MTKTIEAIFEDGVLKPTKPLDIPEHKKMTVIIEDAPERTPDVLSLAAQVYTGLSTADIREIERVALDRTHFTRD